MKLLSTLIAAAALVNTAVAHYSFPKLIFNGVTSQPWEYVRANSNGNSPIWVGSTDLRCATGGANAGSTKVADVQAGSTIGFESSPELFHVGVLTVYLSKAPGSVMNYDASGGWFKIHEIAPTFSPGKISFPTEHKTRFEFSLPRSIQNGEYLLRIEHIALHSMPAQFFLQCAQIRVSGGTGTANPPLVYFPQAYPVNHPGIEINIYNPVPTSYQMPGPAVFRG